MSLYSISKGDDRQAMHRNPFHYTGLHRGPPLAPLPILGPSAGLETELAVVIPVYLPRRWNFTLGSQHPPAGEPSLPCAQMQAS